MTDSLHRTLHSHLNDSEYLAKLARERQEYKDALEGIRALFTKPLVDGRAVLGIVEGALGVGPLARTRVPFSARL